MLNIVQRTLHFTSARNKRKLLISCSYGRTCMKKICGESLTALAWIISVYCHHWMNLHREKSPGCSVTLSLDYSTSLFRLFPIQSLPSQSSNTRSYTNVSGVKCTLLLKRTTMNSAQRNKWSQWKKCVSFELNWQPFRDFFTIRWPLSWCFSVQSTIGHFEVNETNSLIHIKRFDFPRRNHRI